MDTTENPRHITTPKSFVRRSARMTTGQEQAWSEHGKHMLIEVEREEHADTSIANAELLDLETLFGRVAPLVVEIGTGKGEAIVHAAREHPELNFLGIEVYRPGLARTLLNAAEHGLTNVRLIEANAPEVLEKLLPPHSVHDMRVFFPDPWHKSKHTKRRLVSADFTRMAARVLATGGRVRLATDWEHYALQMREVFDAAPAFTRDFSSEWADRFEGRPVTSFENKGVQAGRQIRDLTFVRTD